MSDRHLHIVCFDVPYPVDYGGVFDLFYKIAALHQAGIRIHLHCFEYGRGRQPVLEQYCEAVHYYPRVAAFKSFSLRLPYIVSSRMHPALLANLQKNDYPILLEGMHCTGFLNSGQLPRERCFVRLPNVEYQYYSKLAESTQSWRKRIYYLHEAKLLKQYEAALKDKAAFFWTLTKKDNDDLVQTFGYTAIGWLPLFLPAYQPQWPGEKGSYCLYHGNLGVAENEQAASWLIENLFGELNIPLMIAGKNPSAQLEALIQRYPHVCLTGNPAEAQMQELIQNAQVNILPSFNSTGIKLKLINALYNGRHCLVNKAGVEGSGLDDCCTIANSKEEMLAAIQVLFNQPYTLQRFEERIQKLQALFNNSSTATAMLQKLFQNG